MKSGARFLVAAAWVGSLWTVGYLVAPTLFTLLYDKVLAGTIAGSLFRVEAWVSVGSAIALYVFLLPLHGDDTQKKGLLRLITTMLGCTLFGYFALHPFMESLRHAAGPGGVMQSQAKLQFGILHAVSSLLYLVESFLGVKLLLMLR